eukprot:m.470433 g.470433  ORF g.470433 m.470433 type:complete len:1716 (-) comp20369_c0_seq2:130-5277(-)
MAQVMPKAIHEQNSPTRRMISSEGYLTGFGNCFLCDKPFEGRSAGLFEVLPCGHPIHGSSAMNRGHCCPKPTPTIRAHKATCTGGPMRSVERFVKLQGVYLRKKNIYEHLDFQHLSEEECSVLKHEFQAAIEVFLEAHHADGNLTVEIRGGCIELVGRFVGPVEAGEVFHAFFSSNNIDELFPSSDFVVGDPASGCPQDPSSSEDDLAAEANILAWGSGIVDAEPPLAPVGTCDIATPRKAHAWLRPDCNDVASQAYQEFTQRAPWSHESDGGQAGYQGYQGGGLGWGSRGHDGGQGGQGISFLDVVRTEQVPLRDSETATTYFRKLIEQGPTNCLIELEKTPPEIVEEAVRRVMPDGLNTPILELVCLVSKSEVRDGVYPAIRTKLYTAIFYSISSFADELLKGIKSESVTDLDTVAWFLVQLAKSDPTIREHATVAKILDLLQSEKTPATRALANIVLGVSHQNPTSQTDMQLPPGGRHDNDHANYRDIEVIPTAAELTCRDKPFLPFAPSENDSPADETAEAEAELLDRQFRLMREDLVGPLRDELVAELKLPQEKQRYMFGNPRLAQIHAEPKRVAAMQLRIEVDMPPRILGRLRRKMSCREAKEFFESGPGRKVFGRDTLILFLDKSKSKHPKVLAVGRVCDRETMVVAAVVNKMDQGGSAFLSRDWNAPFVSESLEVGVSFSGPSLYHMVENVAGLGHKKFGKHVGDMVFNATASFFAYEPVLDTLKEMDCVPFREELALGQPSLPADGRDVFYDELPTSIRDAIGSDVTQQKALELALNKRIALVQGPPGTGKTYIGVQIIKAILDRDPTAQVMVLCYTNHALDRVLESLLDADIPPEWVVRLGSQQKVSERLAPRCLRNLDGKSEFDHQQKHHWGVLRDQQKALVQDIEALQRELDKTQWGTSPSWWDTIREFLDDVDPVNLDDLLTPHTSADAAGMQRVGRKGKTVGPNYVWEQWCQGKDRGIFKDEKERPLWDLTHAQRREKREEWRHEWMQPKLQRLADAIGSHDGVVAQLRNLRASNDAVAVGKHRIIGCTTVAAAMRREMLKQVRPSVLMVEEAGEIFEAQVLSCMSQDCKKLILIGDHKQLPPKAENYTLRKESGKGYNLDVSLFERLVTMNECDKVILHVQHRMRPKISTFIRETMYSELEDAPKTIARDDEAISGVKYPVVFVDHRKPEASDDEAAMLGSQSKINPHEADMIARMTRHFLNQPDYDASNLTILTPYLGQLVQIRNRLQRFKVATDLNDRDEADLRRADVDLGQQQQREARQVRVATIDNYQGEECDLILISLVRSNEDRDIGFVGSAQRVNVLLSRARKGMYLVGNMECLSHARASKSRQLWGKIKKLLDERGWLLDAFPAYCAEHDALSEIRSAEEFTEFSPLGGCNQPCGASLPCGHPCPDPCHGGNAEQAHEEARCQQIVSGHCESGHPGKHKCYHQHVRDCKVIVEDRCPDKGHKARRACSAKPSKCIKQARFACPLGHTNVTVCHKGCPVACPTCEELEAEERRLEAEQARRLAKELKYDKEIARIQQQEEAAHAAVEAKLTDAERASTSSDFTRQDRWDIKEAIEEELQGKVSNVTIKTNAIQAETEPGYPDFDLVPADVDYKARNQTGFRQHKTLPDQEPLTKAARNASTGLRNVPGLKDKKSTPGYVLDQAAARAAAENPEAGSYEVFCAALNDPKIANQPAAKEFAKLAPEEQIQQLHEH